MLDCHAHLNLDPLYQNWTDHLDAALKAQVTTLIIPGTNLDTSQKAIDIASQTSHCQPAIGIHPHEADRLNIDQAVDQLKTLAAKNPVIAIGECGLDYFRRDTTPPAKTAQKHLFQAQLQLANELNLPTIIHVRDAHQDALEIIQSLKPRGLLHCFSGNIDYLQSALNLGLYISFCGNLTFNNAANLQKLISHVPLKRLLLETDAPFLNPDRGVWPNTPDRIVKTYRFTANLLSLPLPRLSQTTHQNAQRLFSIEKNLINVSLPID